MLLIKVGNVASIFTQVHMAKETSIPSSFLILRIQCDLHLFLFFEPIWTFSWLFSFVAVTGPMYSGASTFLLLNENPTTNPIAILRWKVMVSIFLFGLSC